MKKEEISLKEIILCLVISHVGLFFSYVFFTMSQEIKDCFNVSDGVYVFVGFMMLIGSIIIIIGSIFMIVSKSNKGKRNNEKN